MHTCTRLALKDIENRLPNIVNLYVNLPNYGESFPYYSNLRHLQKLHVYKCSDDDIVKSIFSSLVDNKQPIDELNINYVDIELGRIRIQNIKTIKNLYIRKAAEHILIDIARNFPALKCLEVHGITRSLRATK